MNDSTATVETSLFSESDGALFVAGARHTLSAYLASGKTEIYSALLSDKRFSHKLGCFVTLRNEEKSLRGCIGFPEPLHVLSKALTQAAICAATEDPRFPPVTRDELDKLTIEISVLTTPKIISVNHPKDYLKQIVIGKHGLVMKWSFGSGLLLPQVPVEENWTVEEFLSNLAMKAGALPDQWLLQDTRIERFEAQVFEELKPGGRVSAKS